MEIDDDFNNIEESKNAEKMLILLKHYERSDEEHLNNIKYRAFLKGYVRTFCVTLVAQNENWTTG